MSEYTMYIIWIWRTLIVVSMLASCYYAYKGDSHKEIISMLHAIIAAVVPLAFYVLE